MKTSVLSFFILANIFLFLLPACTGIKGNGNVVEQHRDVDDFDEIELEGGYEVLIRQGKKSALKIEADENLMEIIKTEVEDRTLHISTEEHIRSAKSLKLYITVNGLQSIDVSGAVKLRSKSKIVADKLSIDVSGAGDIDLLVDVYELDIDLSGGSDTKLAGIADEVSVDISGAGELDAENLEAEKFRINISGAGQAVVNAEYELDAEISGAGKIEYLGDPQIIEDISGAGSIQPKE